MREGTVFFPGEPVLEVTAPLLEAQLVETALVNVVHFQSLIAARAARCVDVADGRRLVEFGLRRAHGAEAGVEVARASYLAGFDATSNVLAGQRYGIPLAGTMAHSYVECFADETAAFEAFTRSYPDGSTLLIDTYDTVEGARRAAAVARELAARGGRLGAVRLDSGDLLELSRRVRAVLDEAGLPDVTIFASGNLDEYAIARAARGRRADRRLRCRLAARRLGRCALPRPRLQARRLRRAARAEALRRQGDAARPEAGLAPARGRPLRGGRRSRSPTRSAPAGAEPLLEPAMSEGRRPKTPSPSRPRACRRAAIRPSAEYRS